MVRVDTLTVSDADLIVSFGNDCKLRNMTRKTIQDYSSQIKIFNSFLIRNDSGLLHIDRDVLRDFIRYLKEERGNSESRVKHYLSGLSTFYEYMVYERLVEYNPVLEVRKRYLRQYKSNGCVHERKLISVEEMAMFIGSIMDPRDKAVAVVLAKTGVRRGELVRVDMEDINWDEMSILLKPTPKRSNRLVFFDAECSRLLRKWLQVREELDIVDGCPALFINTHGGRLNRSGIYNSVIKWATIAGIHNPESQRMEDHFMTHCFRHWFTTHLLRAGMPREYVKELRGDARNEAIDIYHHIDREDLRKSYLACIPELGV